MTDREREKAYEELTAEELEQRLRETFFYPDVIDETVFQELEAIREALERKQPLQYARTAQESWTKFKEDHGTELEDLRTRKAEAALASSPREASAAGAADEGAVQPHRSAKQRVSLRYVLKRVLVAAAVAALLTGAALAAGPRLWVWVRDWSAAPVSFASAGAEAAGGPIRNALKELEIKEPVYPSWLPVDYVLAEAHISQDPLLLYELYTRGDRYISITVTPVTAVEKSMYPQADRLPEEYRAGDLAHYLFTNSGSITGVWYTEHYFVSVNGNITIRVMKRIIDSVHVG